MNEKQKERIKKLYGCKEDVRSYMAHSGTKIGNTTKSNLQQGSVEHLED